MWSLVILLRAFGSPSSRRGQWSQGSLFSVNLLARESVTVKDTKRCSKISTSVGFTTRVGVPALLSPFSL